MLPYMLLSTVVSPGDGQPYCIEHSLWCMLEIQCVVMPEDNSTAQHI
jgi:hypothetical protein